MKYTSIRSPAVGLPAAVLLGLLAAFFAWQAAEPLWLSLGRGEPGTATVTECATVEDGPTYRCVVFEAAGGAYRVEDVALRGGPDPAAGAAVPARMLAPDRTQAYAVDRAGLHLRWAAGLVLVLACGLGIVWATGAARLDRSRGRAVLLSLAGPVVLAAGILVASY